MTPASLDRVFGTGRLKMVTGRYVEVYREASAPGERRRYTKRFLSTREGDFREWTEREWRILARLVGHGARHVPDIVQYDRGASGGHAIVQTYDAGITVDHWATLLPVERGSNVQAHVFQDCAHWWALARYLLLALHEIHSLRLVHLDLKADNICLPYAPPSFVPPGDAPRGSEARGAVTDPADPQLIYPLFEHVALIDFAFSTISGEPLASPLPIGWQRAFPYQSPRLLRALAAGQQGDLGPTQQLDWRCDMFSLAALLNCFVPGAIALNGAAAQRGWTAERHRQAHLLLLKIRDSHDREAASELPHPGMAAACEALLQAPDLVDSLEGGWALAHAPAPADGGAPTAPWAPTTLVEPRTAPVDWPVTDVVPRQASAAPAVGGMPASTAPMPAGLQGAHSPVIDPGRPHDAAPPTVLVLPTAPVVFGPTPAPPPTVSRSADGDAWAAVPATPVTATRADRSAEPESVTETAPTVPAIRAPGPDQRQTDEASAEAAGASSGTPPGTATETETETESGTAFESGTETGTETDTEAETATAQPLPSAAPARAAARAEARPASGIAGAGRQRALAVRAGPLLGLLVVAAILAWPMTQRDATAPPTVPVTRTASDPAPPRAPVPGPVPRPDPAAKTAAAAQAPAPAPAPATTPAPTPATPADTAPAPAQSPSQAPTRVPALPEPADPLPMAEGPDAQRSSALVREVLPGVARLALPRIAEVLASAAQARDDSDDRGTVRAANALRELSFPAVELRPTTPRRAARGRQLNAAAQRAFWQEGDVARAFELQWQAFGAHPQDAEIAGNLAFYALKSTPRQVELSRLLAIWALTAAGRSTGGTRLEDWGNLAVASALSGRPQDALQAMLVFATVSRDVDRSCRSALSSVASFGPALKAPAEAVLLRAHQRGRAGNAPHCQLPPRWSAGSRFP